MFSYHVPSTCPFCGFLLGVEGEVHGIVSKDGTFVRCEVNVVTNNPKPLGEIHATPVTDGRTGSHD